MIRMSIIYKQREMLEIDTWYSNAFDNNDDDDNDEKKKQHEKKMAGTYMDLIMMPKSMLPLAPNKLDLIITTVQCMRIWILCVVLQKIHILEMWHAGEMSLDGVSCLSKSFVFAWAFLLNEQTRTICEQTTNQIYVSTVLSKVHWHAQAICCFFFSFRLALEYCPVHCHGFW